jgi:large subunit ribosomal protein L25
MQTVTIEGKIREGFGKKPNKGLRGEGQVPCVIYGGSEVLHFSATQKSFKALVYTPEFKLAEVSLNGKTYRCIVKELQFHPVTEQLLHVDLMELVPGKRLNVAIPIRLVGTSIGVKKGGKLLHSVRKVTVRLTSELITDHLDLDITEMDLGKSLRIRDIKLEEGMQLMQSGSIPVATIEIPRALRSAQAAESKEAGKKKK